MTKAMQLVSDSLPSVYKVLWIDSTSLNGWHSQEEIDINSQLDMCVSVGFIVKETEALLTLSTTWAENEVLGITVIPKSAIKERKYIPI